MSHTNGKSGAHVNLHLIRTIDFRSDEARHIKDVTARNDAIVAEYETGSSISGVASKTGVSHQTVANVLRQRGVAVRPTGWHGHVQHRNADSTIPTDLSARDREIIERYRNGESSNKIAASMTPRISHHTVLSIVRRHGLDVRPRGWPIGNSVRAAHARRRLARAIGVAVNAQENEPDSSKVEQRLTQMERMLARVLSELHVTLPNE